VEAAEHRLGPDRAGHRLVQELSATESARRVNARVGPTREYVDSEATLMAIRTAGAEFKPGEGVIVSGASPSTPFAAVFEDDGETGYFYALDTSKSEYQILDAVHVYDVTQVLDRERASGVEVTWSSDGLRVILRINGYPHAAFDFVKSRGYCRTGLPKPAAGGFSSAGHEWSDEVLGFFD
jgi:hypothetical protein